MIVKSSIRDFKFLNDSTRQRQLTPQNYFDIIEPCKMQIDLTDLLKETGNELYFNDKVSVAYPKEEVEVNGPVNVSIHFTNADELVIAKGKISADIKLVCSRCLNEYIATIEAEIDEQCSKKMKGQVETRQCHVSTETEIEDLDIFFPINNDNTIDLSELIRQNLVLNIPIKTLCKESCRGLDSEKKEEHKIDPRLSKLKDFK